MSELNENLNDDGLIEESELETAADAAFAKMLGEAELDGVAGGHAGMMYELGKAAGLAEAKRMQVRLKFGFGGSSLVAAGLLVVVLISGGDVVVDEGVVDDINGGGGGGVVIVDGGDVDGGGKVDVVVVVEKKEVEKDVVVGGLAKKVEEVVEPRESVEKLVLDEGLAAAGDEDEDDLGGLVVTSAGVVVGEEDRVEDANFMVALRRQAEAIRRNNTLALAMNEGEIDLGGGEVKVKEKGSGFGSSDVLGQGGSSAFELMRRFREGQLR